MSRETENTVLDIACEIAERHGIYVVDVEYKKEGKDWFVRVYIDKDGGVSIDDCEKISRELDEEMDRQDPISGQYYLEVSSPGVDRKLKKEREFLYYIGRDVDVKLYKPWNGKKEFRGILKDFHDKAAFVETDGETVKINTSDAVWIRLAFDF
ncbi:MAG: ribosome maturation factor RimP [Clostridia bacterium]|nr:ribosome maturation factor RimP [Clostridia bacterium]